MPDFAATSRSAHTFEPLKRCPRAVESIPARHPDTGKLTVRHIGLDRPHEFGDTVKNRLRPISAIRRNAALGEPSRPFW